MDKDLAFISEISTEHATKDESAQSHVTDETSVASRDTEHFEEVTGDQSADVTPVADQLRKIELPCIERPCFAVYDRLTLTQEGEFSAGVWWHGHASKRSGEQVPVDIWVCSPIHVIAVTSNDNASFGRLLRFRNTLGVWREWAMPMRLLKAGGEELRGELLDQGVEIAPDGRAYLDRYLQAQKPERRVTAASCTGWHSETLFIIPEKNIGQGDAIYQSEYAYHSDFEAAGDLDRWNQTVGMMLPGNPLLQLALGQALSGPLLNLLQKDGGGFHIFGDSSSGKTTLIEAACSVYGHGDRFKRTWRATSNGLEGIASQRNDTMLALDEIGEADPKECGNVVYLLANGTGKARANRSGDARQAKRWKVSVISSGEKRLSDVMAEAGKRRQTGQELRFIELSANRAYGCWDQLHDYPDGQTASNAVKKACRTHYGHLGIALIEVLIHEGEMDHLPKMLETILQYFSCESGQEQRAAERFAIVALALELARGFGLIRLDEGEPTGSMVRLFNEWRQNRAGGNGEDQTILKSLSDFVSRHGDSLFSELPNGHDQHFPPVRDRAGWWIDKPEQRIYLFTSEGLSRAVPGVEVSRITQAANRAKWIHAHDQGSLSKNKRVEGRQKRLYFIAVQDL